MYTRPKTWVQGESGVRAESVNKSISNNLEAVRSLSSSYTAVSAYYPTSEMTFPTFFIDKAIVSYDFPSMLDTDNLSVWGMEDPTYVSSSSQAGIVWIPMASLLAAKKSTESLYWNISVTARPKYVSIPGQPPAYQYGFLADLPALMGYQYLGSSLDQNASTTIRTRSWNPTYSSGSGTQNRAYWGTGNIPIDTQDMSSTNVDICAFRISFRMYCQNTYNFAMTQAAIAFGINVTVGIG